MFHKEALAKTALPLLVFFALFGIQLFFQGRTLAPVPGNPFLDVGALEWVNWPMAKIVHEMLAHGGFSAWSGSIGIGVPIVQDPHNSFLSPFSAILYLWPNSYGWDVMIAARLGLLIYFTYRLLRVLAIESSIALGCATLYGFSGHVLAFLHHFHMNSVVFSPLFILGSIHALEGRPRRAVVPVTVGLALGIFGGGLLDVVLMSLFAGFLGLVFLMMRRDLGVPERASRLGTVVCWCALGALLSAVFILPYVEWRGVSVPPYAGRSRAEFRSLVFFLGSFVSNIWDVPADFPESYRWDQQSFPLLLLLGAVLGGMAAWRRRKERHGYVWAASLAMFAFYFLKLYGFPLLRWVNFTPLLRDVRFEKYYGEATLALTMLAAGGFNEFLLILRERRSRAVFPFVLLSIFPWAYALYAGHKSLFWTAGYSALPVAAFFALSRLGKVSVRWAAVPWLVLIALQAGMDGRRTLMPRWELFDNSADFGAALMRAGKERVLPLTGDGPRIWSARGFRDVRDISVVFDRRYYSFAKDRLEGNSCWHSFVICVGDVSKLSLDAARVLGVKYLVFEPKQEAGVARLLGPGDHVQEAGKLRLAELAGTKPLLEVEPAGVVRVLSDGDSGVEAEVESSSPALVTYRALRAPGWEARVDGARAELKEVDQFFQAVSVPAGRHRMEFRYTHGSLTAGALISVVAFLVIAAIAAGLIRPRA